MKQLIYDIDNWSKVGRGIGMQFYAADDEIAAWLATAMPPEFAPYSLIGSDLKKKGSAYVEKYFAYSISGSGLGLC